MNQNKGIILAVSLCFLSLTACGGLFKAMDGKVSYNSIHQNILGETVGQDDADNGNSSHQNSDAGDNSNPTENPPDTTPYQFNLLATINGRCEVGELDILRFLPQCQSTTPLIFTIKDSSKEKMIKNFGSVMDASDVERILDSIDDIDLTQTISGKEVDLFICTDGDLDGSCMDETIGDLNKFNPALLKAFGKNIEREQDKVMASRKKDKNRDEHHPNQNVVFDCNDERVAALKGGFVLFHTHRNFAEKRGDREDVAEVVEQFLKNIEDIKLNAASNGGTEALEIHLAVYDANKCHEPMHRTNGCFVKGTKIGIDERLSLPVEDLNAGDAVLLANGKTSKILKVVKGPETKPVIEIRTQDNHTLSVTDRHPMLTQRGIIMAKDISLDDKLKLVSGRWVEISSVQKVIYKEDVYNFALEGEKEDQHLVIANDVVSGDLHLQNKLELNERAKNSLALQGK